MKQQEKTLGSEVLTNTARLVCPDVFDRPNMDFKLLDSYIAAYLFGNGNNLKEIRKLTNIKFSLALKGYKVIVEDNNVTSFRALDFYFYDHKKTLEEKLYYDLLHKSSQIPVEEKTEPFFEAE